MILDTNTANSCLTTVHGHCAINGKRNEIEIKQMSGKPDAEAAKEKNTEAAAASKARQYISNRNVGKRVDEVEVQKPNPNPNPLDEGGCAPRSQMRNSSGCCASSAGPKSNNFSGVVDQRTMHTGK